MYARNARPPPRIQVSLERLESFTKKHDRAITAVLFICIAVITSIVFTSHLVSHPSVTFRDKWHKTSKNVTTKHSTRTIKRALSIMESNCNGQTSTFGPQVHINGAAWDSNRVYICDMGIHLIAPRAIVIGDSYVKCEEEHQGVRKIKDRRHPITIKTNNGETHTITAPVHACAIWNAIELISGIW